MKVLIENSIEGNCAWIELPNGDIKTAISDVMGSTELWTVKEIECELKENNFLLCNLIEFNELLMELDSIDFDFNDVKNLSVLNMLLEDRHYSIECVINIIFGDGFHIYNVESVDEIAKAYLRETTSWYDEFEESNLLQYFDFNAYGEQMVRDGDFLIDEDNKIFLELI